MKVIFLSQIPDWKFFAIGTFLDCWLFLFRLWLSRLFWNHWLLLFRIWLGRFFWKVDSNPWPFFVFFGAERLQGWGSTGIFCSDFGDFRPVLLEIFKESIFLLSGLGDENHSLGVQLIFLIETLNLCEGVFEKEIWVFCKVVAFFFKFYTLVDSIYNKILFEESFRDGVRVDEDISFISHELGQHHSK